MKYGADSVFGNNTIDGKTKVKTEVQEIADKANRRAKTADKNEKNQNGFFGCHCPRQKGNKEKKKNTFQREEALRN